MYRRRGRAPSVWWIQNERRRDQGRRRRLFAQLRCSTCRDRKYYATRICARRNAALSRGVWFKGAVGRLEDKRRFPERMAEDELPARAEQIGGWASGAHSTRANLSRPSPNRCYTKKCSPLVANFRTILVRSMQRNVVIAILLSASVLAIAAMLNTDYITPPFTFSPNHRYGVVIPVFHIEAAQEPDERMNKVVELRTHQIVAVIHGEP